MKKLITMILAATVTATCCTGFFITEAVAESASTSTPMVTTEPSEKPTEPTLPTKTEVPTATATTDTTKTEVPTVTATTDTTETPSETPTEEPTAVPEAASVYVIRSAGSILLTYNEDSKTFTSEIMMQQGEPVSLQYRNDNNFVPFRYLFEKFGVEAANNYNFEDNTTLVIDEMVNENTLANYDMNYKKILEEKKNATGVYAWQLVKENDSDYKVNIRVFPREGNPYAIKAGESIEGIETDPVYVDNGHTYIPLRALQLINYICEYDYQTDSIFIINSLAKDDSVVKKMIGENLNGVVPQLYKAQFNSNYTSYAYAYKIEEQITGLYEPAINNKNEESLARCYCVNQYGDMLVYLDNEQQIRVRKLTENAGAIVKANGMPVIADKIFFDGKNIYGVKINSKNDTEGRIFSATLSVTNEGYYVLNNLHKLFNISASQFLYKAIPNSNGGYNKYIYFIDVKDSETIKRLNTSVLDINDEYAGNKVEDIQAEPEVIKDSKGPLKDIGAFTIAGRYIIYSYQNKEIVVTKLLETDSAFVSQVGDAIQIESIHGMISNDGVGDQDAEFYFIKGNTDSTDNTVVELKIETDSYSEEEFYNDKKIRNIALIDGKLYGRIDDGDYTEIPPQEK